MASRSLLLLTLMVAIISSWSNVIARNPCIEKENPQIAVPSSGKGSVLKIGELDCYVNGPENSNVSVLMFPDVFGYAIPHLRMIADEVAAAGFYTVVPDFFHGDPYVQGNPNRPFQIWFKDHQPEQGFVQAKPLVDSLRAKGMNKIGAAGFCWGAKTNVDLNKNGDIQTSVLLHPTYVTLDDIGGVKAPIEILGGENDTMTPPERIRTYEAILKERKMENYVKVFNGAEHGWTTRYNDTDTAAVKRAQKAHKLIVNWLVKHLK